MANPPLPTHIFVGAARSRSETRGGVFRQAMGDDRWEHLTKGLPVVGGVMKSPDAGETWQDCSADLLRLAELPHLKSRIDSDTDIEGMLDGHALCVSAARPGTVFLAVRMGLFRSAERGAHWQTMDIGRFSPLTYSRDLRVSPHDPRVLYACLSPAARSQGQARPADALDPAQVRDVVDGVVREFGRVDILVNAVGGSTIIARPAALVDELTLAEWQRLITFNLDGTFLFCHTVGPVMKRQRGGKIVNISSIAGRGLSPSSSSAYAAAKGGIIAFTRKLAHELGPFGVTVNAIAPSLTLTERIRPRWAQRTLDEQAQEIARTPLRRVAEAPDQARVICFLASRDADFVTGVTIDVTGGV